jgi:hypothetical protein
VLSQVTVAYNEANELIVSEFLNASNTDFIQNVEMEPSDVGNVTLENVFYSCNTINGEKNVAPFDQLSNVFISLNVTIDPLCPITPCNASSSATNILTSCVYCGRSWYTPSPIMPQQTCESCVGEINEATRSCIPGEGPRFPIIIVGIVCGVGIAVITAVIGVVLFIRIRRKRRGQEMQLNPEAEHLLH